MSEVTIITDSSAYLPAEITAALPIHVIPLSLLWDGQVYRDGVDITPDEFYARLDTSRTLPTTSQVTINEFSQAYQAVVERGGQALVLPISSGISSSLQSALQAQTQFPAGTVEVMDSKLVSMALGFQVMAAARAAQAGASLAECRQTAERAYGQIGVFFTVDTLKYLAAGGRINSARRLLGTALNIKPVLEIRDGKIELVESVISKRKAVERMVALAEKAIAGRKPVRISVFHAADETAARALLERTTAQFGAVESILSYVSPVVGSHTGSGTLSLAYMAGE